MEDLTKQFDGLTKVQVEEKYKEYQSSYEEYYNYEQAVKRILNSIYGAFGNEYFYFFNLDIAESVTLQGQDAILYTEKMLNIYFNEFWHKDKELHKIMNIEVTGQCLKPVTIYIDTDSCYVSFEEVVKKSNWTGSTSEFILALYENRLKDYLVRVLDKYAATYKSENYLNFELESIARNAIWLAKKKYIQNLEWADPNVNYADLSKIKTKGFDNIQSSTPLYARKKLSEALKLIFSKGKTFHVSDIVKFLNEAKKEFKLAKIEDISYNFRVNNYEKYVVDDQKSLEFALKTPANCRAAGFYNHKLNNSKLKSKYHPISSGEKIKYYECIDKQCSVFGYIAGALPYEFAPEVDYEGQFEKCMIEPLNRVLAVMGLQTLNRNLLYANSLF